MGCNSSKPEKPITIDVDEPFRPIASHDNLQNALTRTADGKHRASTGSSAVPSSAASAKSQATTSLNGVYNALLPLQGRYWIDPDDCGSSRKIKSSYMQTHLGYYQVPPCLSRRYDSLAV